MIRRHFAFLILLLGTPCAFAGVEKIPPLQGYCSCDLESATLGGKNPYVVVTAKSSCTLANLRSAHIDWGDGTEFSTDKKFLQSHEYRTPGDYVVTASLSWDEIFAGLPFQSSDYLSITVPPPVASPTDFESTVWSLLAEDSDAPPDEQGDGVVDAADVLLSLPGS